MDKSILDKLELLKSLLDEGAITKEDFERRKNILFDGAYGNAGVINEKPVTEESTSIDSNSEVETESNDCAAISEPQQQQESGSVSSMIEKKSEKRPKKSKGKKKLYIGLTILFVLVAICAVIGYANRVRNTIIDNGGFTVYNRGGSVYYQVGDETTRIFPNKEMIDVIFLSYENGKLRSKKVATPVSDYMDKNYNHRIGVDYYKMDLYSNDGYDIVYITNSYKPNQGLVYLKELNQYYHVNSVKYDDDQFVFGIPSDESFDSPLLKELLTPQQLSIFYDNHIGQVYRVVTIDSSGKAKLRNKIGYESEDYWDQHYIIYPELESKTKEDADYELITKYFWEEVRRIEWKQMFKENPVLSKDFLFEELSKNRIRTQQYYIDGDYWTIKINAYNIFESYKSGYKYRIAEDRSGCTIYTNDEAFAKLSYPAELIVSGQFIQMDSEAIIMVNGEYIAQISDIGISTYDGIILGNTRVKLYSSDY